MSAMEPMFFVDFVLAWKASSRPLTFSARSP